MSEPEIHSRRSWWEAAWLFWNHHDNELEALEAYTTAREYCHMRPSAHQSSRYVQSARRR